MYDIYGDLYAVMVFVGIPSFCCLKTINEDEFSTNSCQELFFVSLFLSIYLLLDNID